MNNMLKQIEGRCTECDCWTERYDDDNEDWCCQYCNDKAVRGQEEDRRLDDPRHGQAADINRQK